MNKVSLMSKDIDEPTDYDFLASVSEPYISSGSPRPFQAIDAAAQNIPLMHCSNGFPGQGDRSCTDSLGASDLSRRPQDFNFIPAEEIPRLSTGSPRNSTGPVAGDYHQTALESQMCLNRPTHSQRSPSTAEASRMKSSDCESSSPRSENSRTSTCSSPTSLTPSSVTSARRRDDVVAPAGSRCRRKPKPQNGVVPDAASRAIKIAAQSILRDDTLQYLEAELPRWRVEALWSNTKTISGTASQRSAFSELEIAYSSVCQLDVRMGDDAIRHRMALVRLHLEYVRACEPHNGQRSTKAIGRGGASVIIDTILMHYHDGWDALDDRKRSDLRSKFHDRKRFGKRWLYLVDALGLGILLICSTRIANMMYDHSIQYPRNLTNESS